jgi:hypothetical protein
MWKPLKQLIARFRKPQKVLPLLTPEQEAELRAAQEKLSRPPRRKPKGRVIKQTHAVDFNPNPVSGGRIVRVMPRSLQKIKQAQEKVEHDEIPRIED